MQQEGETARSMARSLKTAVGYAAGRSGGCPDGSRAVRIVFCSARFRRQTGDCRCTEACSNLFAIPEDGDFVVYEGESDLSEGKRLKTGRYDGDRITMDRVRGKIIIVIPMRFPQ